MEVRQKSTKLQDSARFCVFTSCFTAGNKGGKKITYVMMLM